MALKVAVTVKEDTGLKATLDPRFGRSSYFLIAEKEGNGWSALDIIPNDARDEANGAGGKAAATMSRLGVYAVISGRFGPKAYKVLSAIGIHMWLASGPIDGAAALDAFDRGALEEMTLTVY